MTSSHLPCGVDRSSILTLAVCCIATFLVPLDITVVAVALDRIGQSTHAGFTVLQWILNGYTLAFTSTLLTGGSLADVFGRRRMMVIGTAAFALTSLICAVVGNPIVLIGARILQGISGAIMLTAAMGVMATRFRGAERPRHSQFGE